MGLLDDALARGQELVQSIAPRDVEQLPYNPTLAAVNAPAGEPQPREPIKKSTVVAADGTATITCDPVDPNTTWLLDYVVVTCSSTNQTQCQLYEGDVSDSNLIDGTGKGNRGIAWYTPPRRIAGTRQLVAQWTGGVPGAKCTLRVEYRVEASP